VLSSLQGGYHQAHACAPCVCLICSPSITKAATEALIALNLPGINYPTLPTVPDLKSHALEAPLEGPQLLYSTDLTIYPVARVSCHTR
jgi:hypothetical protein